jgi:transposase-like protein
MRPQKISHQLIDAICEDIAQGFTYDQAAQRNGISASTFFRWMVKAKEPDCDPIYIHFATEVEAASQFSEFEALQIVRSAAIISRNWKAATWFLEKRFPEKYGKSKNLIYEEVDASENSEES